MALHVVGGDRLLELLLRAVDLGPRLVRGRVSVELHELGDVELGRLEDLGLTDKDVLEEVDRLAGLLNLLADRLGNAVREKVVFSGNGGVRYYRRTT